MAVFMLTLGDITVPLISDVVNYVHSFNWCSYQQLLCNLQLQLDEGDYVDYVFTSEDGSTKLKRVRVVKIEHSGGPEKQKVYLRVWRSPQDPP